MMISPLKDVPDLGLVRVSWNEMMSLEFISLDTSTSGNDGASDLSFCVLLMHIKSLLKYRDTITVAST